MKLMKTLLLCLETAEGTNGRTDKHLELLVKLQVTTSNHYITQIVLMTNYI